MRKILTLLFSFMMVFTLFACGDKNNNNGETTDNNDVEQVAVFWYSFDDDYLSTVRATLNNEFKAAGISYKDYDCNGNQTDQTNKIFTVLATGVKVLVVNQVESNAVDTTKTILDAAKDAGAKVVFFNRSISVDDTEAEALLNDYGSAFIGTDYEQAGHFEGKMVGEYLLAHYDELDLNKDGKISYVMLKGQETNTEAIARTLYSVEDANVMLKEAGKPELAYYDEKASNKYLVDVNGTWSSEAAYNHIESVLSEYNEENGNMPELIIANNDGMALGAIRSLKEHGYNNGKDATTIPVFGVDAIQAAKDAIDAGEMAGTVKQDSDGMAKVVYITANNLLAGEAPIAHIPDEFEIIGTWRVNIPYSTYIK